MKFPRELAALVAACLMASSAPAERINQEGRLLGELPLATSPILFNTTNADAVVAAMQIFPVTNPWNESVSNRPVLPNSDAMIGQIYNDVGASHRYLKIFPEMNFVLVPDSQLLVSNEFIYWPDQSDLNGGISPYGLYPTPTNQPVEGWPLETGNQTLAQWQTNNDGSDRHSIAVQPGVGRIFETWNAVRVGSNWQAANGAMFDLNNNSLRPDEWTSGDAAGFPMFPALVRYDECVRGMVEHACRLIVVRTRSEHIYPATHDAGSVPATATNYPAMGQRLRLKAGFAIPANWTREEKAIALGLKKYGAMVSDNSSSFFSISVTPDNRWPSGAFDHLNAGGLSITNFEVVQTTGPNEGPRSPGAPAANAGVDRIVPAGQPVTLQGAVVFSNSSPVIRWRSYSGPAAVILGNSALTNSTVTFNSPGVYTLMLSADDGVHAVAYDAVVFTASNAVVLGINSSGTNVNLTWTGGLAPFVVQQSPGLPVPQWINALTTSQQTATFPITNQAQFFRVQSQ